MFSDRVTLKSAYEVLLNTKQATGRGKLGSHYQLISRLALFPETQPCCRTKTSCCIKQTTVSVSVPNTSDVFVPWWLLLLSEQTFIQMSHTQTIRLSTLHILSLWCTLCVPTCLPLHSRYWNKPSWWIDLPQCRHGIRMKHFHRTVPQE